MHIISPGLMKWGTRIVLTITLITILFLPVVIVLKTESIMRRLVVILMASVAFIIAMSVIGKAKAVDLFVAGAT